MCLSVDQPTENAKLRMIIVIVGKGFICMGGNSIKIVLPFSYKKEFTLKEEFAPWSQCFPFRIYSFYEGL